MTFKELGLNENLVKAVEELGFSSPTPIQEKSIPPLLGETQDYVGLAQTGTGKTAAFGLPMIQHVDVDFRAIQGLILCPTRELCMQITKELKGYAKYSEGVNVVAVYGGASITDQIRAIKKGVNIVVGTPGRTIDLMERKVVKFDTVSKVVLDEADEMLNMGFKEDINKILEKTPPHKNVWLFSATMPKEVERIANNYMTDPVKVTVGGKNSSAQNIDHKYCLVTGRDRYYGLRRFIDYYPGMFGVVFCRTRRETQEFAERLIADGYNADALHGDLTQAQRDNVMNKFRNRTLQILIATDVAARGIDVDDITHVFHMDLPDEIESYTHRSGRTARAGKSGTSISLVSPSKSGKIRLVEKQINKKLELIKIPSGKDICGRQIFKLIQTIHDAEIDEKGIAPYLDEIYEKFNDFSKEELIQRFISTEFNRFLKVYEKAGDINVDPKNVRNSRDRGDRRDRGDGRDRGRSGENDKQNSNRLFINVGKMDGFENKGQILGFICNQSGIDGTSIGRIDLFDTFAFMGVEDGVGEKVIESLNGKNVEDRNIRIEFSKDRPKGERGGGSSSSSRGRGGSSGGGNNRSYRDKKRR